MEDFISLRLLSVLLTLEVLSLFNGTDSRKLSRLCEHLRLRIVFFISFNHLLRFTGKYAVINVACAIRS